MTLPHGPRSPPRSSAVERWEGLLRQGRIPNGPRGHHRFEDRDERYLDRWRPSPDRYDRDHKSRRSSRRQNDRDTDLFVPEYQNPMQFLAEGFARRQRELREQAERQEAEVRETYRYQQHRVPRYHNRVWIRNSSNELLEPQTVGAQSSSEQEVKEEPLDDFVPWKRETGTTASSTGEWGESDLLPSSKPAGDRQEDFEEDGEIADDPAGSLPVSPNDTDPPSDDDSPPEPNPVRCLCPIQKRCPAREDGKSDCRTLVWEKDWSHWQKKWDAEYQLALPPDVEPEEEPFATLQEVSGIIRQLDLVGLRRLGSMALRDAYFKIREWIRRMSNHSVTEDDLNQSGVLHRIKTFLGEDNGQMRKDKEVPWEIVEDLTYFHTKWTFGDLSILARRGLRRVGRGSNWAVDQEWPWVRKGSFYGHGHLVNGQTWLTRVAMARDGAHRPYQAGICGPEDQGVESVCMGLHDEAKKEFYADIDEGKIVHYCSTALPRREGNDLPTNLKDATQHRKSRITENQRGEGPTSATLAMVTSYRKGTPIRLFRSFRLAEIVRHRPLQGFRYDGLYIIQSYELLNIDRQIYRFKMMRMEKGQGPVRETNPPEQSKKRQSRKRKRGEGDS